MPSLFRLGVLELFKHVFEYLMTISPPPIPPRAIPGNLSNGRFRGDGDLDRKLSHDPCITAHDLANFPAVAGTSAT